MKSSTTFTVLFFGPMAELTGVRTEEIDAVVINTVDALLKYLKKKYAAADNLDALLSACAVAVNMEYAYDRNAVIVAGDEIAIIPPVSSG